jgi:glycosyltransferase involved in cell wall biosynthesis
VDAEHAGAPRAISAAEAVAVTSTPLVSVLMTAYNRGPFIASSIQSVLAQTFTDFELLIVDDRSTDDTLEIARDYERRDGRIRVAVNERNLGQFANRNYAATLARGSLLKYHDSDDLMYPHCLAVMVPMLLSEPRAAFGLSSGGVWPGGPCPMLLTPRMAYQREFFGAGLFMCGPAGALFRADAFQRLGGFVDRGVPSDSLFWLRACAIEHIVLFPADLFWYRMHSSQEFHSVKGQREYARVAGAFWRALDAPECPLTPEERDRAKRNRAYHLMKRTLQELRRGRWRFAWERLRQSNMNAADWLRYLRPPQREAFAGTPLGPDGDFVTPGWAKTPRPESFAQ